MGNIFTKELKCNECKKLNLKPTFFTEENLINNALYYEKHYDKYGNLLHNDKIQHFRCSKGHNVNFK